MGKIIYLAHYSGDGDNREMNPAAAAVMNYVIESVNAVGEDLVILSPSQLVNRQSCPRQEKQINTQTKCIYVPSLKWYSRKNLLRKIVQKIRREWNLCRELKKVVEDGDTLLVYHSLMLIHAVKHIRRIRKINLILQVCEVYSDVGKTVDLRKRAKEVGYIHTADKYIFMTDMMAQKLANDKPYAVCHGTYRCEPMYVEKKENEKIHVLYAGTLDPRKGGAIAAATAAYLPSVYRLHILGYGSEEEKKYLRNAIQESRLSDCAEVTYDGQLSGEEYIHFVQSCDIGLSTQNPDAAFNATSFPSKILSYMSNGLRVVSVRIPAIETSAVGDYLYYYDVQTPEEIAKAIMKVDLADNYNSRDIIAQLDREFCAQIKDLLR